MMDRLWILAVDFLMLSLLTVGGATTMLPEMHRNLVEVQGWMSSEEFAQLFALAQAAPGPNVLVISVFGWKAAGVAGALVATLAMILPSCLLTYYADGFLRSPAGAVGRMLRMTSAPCAMPTGLMRTSLPLRPSDRLRRSGLAPSRTAGAAGLTSNRAGPLKTYSSPVSR